MRNLVLFFIAYTCSLFSYGQQIKIGEWQEHLNYTNVNVSIKAGQIFYAGTKSGLFSYNTSDNSIETFSQIEGLSSLNITALAYDSNRSSLIIGYQN